MKINSHFPIVGYIIFLAELSLYNDFNEDFQVEKQFVEIEGDPWAVGTFDKAERLAEEADKKARESYTD